MRTAVPDTGLASTRGVVVGRHRQIVFDPDVHIAAVVAGEEDDRVISQPQFLQFVEHDTDAAIHHFDHGCHGGAVLPPVGPGKPDVLVTHGGLGLNRPVYIVPPHVHEKRPVAVLFDVVGRPCRQHVVHMVARDDRRSVGPGGRNIGVSAERRKIPPRRSGVMPAANDKTKPLVVGNILIPAQMPLAQKCSGVPRPFHALGIGYVSVRQTGARPTGS